MDDITLSQMCMVIDTGQKKPTDDGLDTVNALQDLATYNSFAVENHFMHLINYIDVC